MSNIKTILIIISVLGAGYFVQKMMDKQKKSLEQSIEEAEYGHVWSEEKYQQQKRQMAEALDKATNYIQNEEYRKASGALYKTYPTFESFSNSYGYRKVEGEQQTMREWFENEKKSFETLLLNKMPKIVEKLKTAEIEFEEVYKMNTYMPFPFIHKFKSEFRQYRNEIMKARHENSRNWIIVNFTTNRGDMWNYEKEVRDAVLKGWSSENKAKLVLGKSFNSNEQYSAQRWFNVEIEEKGMTYTSESDMLQVSSKEIPEQVTVTIEKRGKNNITCNNVG